MNWMNSLHDWQKEGFTKVLKKCNRSVEHNPIPVNASVGSGKTFFASLAYADFIDLHRDEKTIQFFVTPRIKLCAQQSNEIIEKIQQCEPFAYQKFENFPGNGLPFQIIPVDSTHPEWNRHNDNLTTQHVIFIICDASLWGEDKSNPGIRWNRWMNRIKKWKADGYVFGNIIFDEAHNFKNDDKVEKMFGTKLFKKHMKFDYENNNCLMTHFQNVVLLSGTPAAYQKDITYAFSKNACECPLNVAISNSWVEYPILNLVCIEASRLFPTSVIKVLEHEVNEVKPVNGVRLLVNFGSIPEIDEFENDPYMKNQMGKDFHFVTIHSDIDLKNDDLTVRKCRSMINGENYSSSDVYDLLEGLDYGFTENEKMQPVLKSILDGKPIIVGQVAMIGEGINIKSFNSVITKSNSDTTAMQQIGRVLRKYKKGNNEKHFPNVYCVYENVESLKTLLIDLRIEHSLTADCFDWGKRIEIKGNGYSGKNEEEDEVKSRSEIGWEKIDPNTDLDIIMIQYSDEFCEKELSKNYKNFTADDKYDVLVKEIGSLFTDDDVKELRYLTNDLKRTNARQGHSKIKCNKGKNKKRNKKDKKVDEAPASSVLNNEPISSVDVNHDENIIQNEDVEIEENVYTNKEEENEERTYTNANEFIYELIRFVHGWILHHQKNTNIIKNTKEHPEYLIEMLFAHVPELAKKIIECGTCKNDNFLSLIGLK